MTIETLVEKVENAALKVEKCKGTIERHKKQLEKKAKVLIDNNINIEICDQQKDRYQNGKDLYWEICEYKEKKEDIRNATKKLNDAEMILENWKCKLEKEQGIQSQIENNIPKVIKDFMENWKQKTYEWHIDRYNKYQKLKEKLENEKRETILNCVNNMEDYARYRNQDLNDYDLLNLHPRQPINDKLKELNLDYKSINIRKMNFAGYIVQKMDDIYDEEERLSYLNNLLEEDKKHKLIDLMQKINKIVGKITDAANLSIGEKGEINGFIIGVDGKAKIETISAGGYNIQCWHFRTLVNEIK